MICYHSFQPLETAVGITLTGLHQPLFSPKATTQSQKSIVEASKLGQIDFTDDGTIADDA